MSCDTLICVMHNKHTPEIVTLPDAAFEDEGPRLPGWPTYKLLALESGTRPVEITYEHGTQWYDHSTGPIPLYEEVSRVVVGLELDAPLDHEDEGERFLAAFDREVPVVQPEVQPAGFQVYSAPEAGRVTACKACGFPILWIQKRRWIALDVRSVVVDARGKRTMLYHYDKRICPTGAVSRAQRLASKPNTPPAGGASRNPKQEKQT